MSLVRLACRLPAASAVGGSSRRAAAAPPSPAGSRAARAAAPRPPGRPAAPAPPRPGPAGGTIQAITVEGNQRIEAGTIRSYMLVQLGDPFDPDRLDRSLKTLYATGLFQDVQLTRQGDTLRGARGGEPAGQPRRLRGQSQAERRHAPPGDAAQAARGVHPGAGRGRPPQDPRSLCPEGLLRRQRRCRRSSACRRTA